MNTYLVDPRGNGGEQFTVEAAEIGQAARLAAKAIFPRLSIGVPDAAYFIQRETGSSEGSGMFRLWKNRGDAQTDRGCPFHVMEM